MSRKLLKQMPRLQEIGSVQSLGEGVENRAEKVAGFFVIALIEPKLGEVDRSTKFEQLRPLPASHLAGSKVTLSPLRQRAKVGRGAGLANGATQPA